MTNQNPDSTRSRRSRKARILGLLVGVTAVAAMLPAGAGASLKVVQEDAWMQYQPPTSGVTPFLFGGLGNSKPVCRHDRTIELDTGSDQYGWTVYDRFPAPAGMTEYLSSTDLNTYYRLSIDAKKVRKANGQKVFCTGAISDPVLASN